MQNNAGGHLSIKVDHFSCKVRFLLFDHCPVPCILGVEFLMSAQILIDFAALRYSFRFQSEKNFSFQCFDFCRGPSHRFPCSEDAFRHLATPCFR
jgi:hypothetical protein